MQHLFNAEVATLKWFGRTDPKLGTCNILIYNRDLLILAGKTWGLTSFESSDNVNQALQCNNQVN
jgi:hypothetical protein